jgi:AraC-like DNA-binding protein
MYTTVQILRIIIYAAAARGGDLQKLTLAAGLRPEQLQHSDHKVEGVTPVINLWEETLSATGDDCFGLHLGERYNPSMLGLLGYLIQSCRTVGDAYELLEKYQELISGWISYRFEKKENHCEISFKVSPLWQKTSPHTAKQAIEMAMSGSLMCHKMLAQFPNPPISAELSYPRTSSLAEYERVFGCTVSFEKENNKLVFDASFAERQLFNYNESLYSSFSQMLNEKAALTALNESFTKQLQRIIVRDFQGQVPKLEIISAHMNLSERSLQRKLHDEKESYRSVSLGLKKEFAFNLLKNSNATIHTISEVLGYTEPSAFHRAFKSWTQSTPLKKKRDLS